MSLIRGSPSLALLGQQAGFDGNDCDENKLCSRNAQWTLFPDFVMVAARGRFLVTASSRLLRHSGEPPGGVVRSGYTCVIYANFH